MAIIVDIPFRALEGKEPVPEAERCTYEAFEERCPERRQAENIPMCDAHHSWSFGYLSLAGAPYPQDQRSMHVFLTTLLEMVVSGKISPQKARMVDRILKMMWANFGRR